MSLVPGAVARDPWLLTVWGTNGLCLACFEVLLWTPILNLPAIFSALIFSGLKKKPSWDYILCSSLSVEKSASLAKGLSLIDYDIWIFSLIYSRDALAFATVKVSMGLDFLSKSSLVAVSKDSIACWFDTYLLPAGSYVMFLPKFMPNWDVCSCIADWRS